MKKNNMFNTPDNYNDCDDCAFLQKETDGMVGVCPECDGTNLSTYESRVNKDTQ
jgi:ssDNA-binding Zn-finger/Zn-ribbon topoisomerase 1